MEKKIINLGVIPNRKSIVKLSVVKAKGEPGRDLLWSSLSPQEQATIISVIAQIVGPEIAQNIGEQLNLSAVALSGDFSDLINVPESFPASDVPAWAKQSNPPTVSKDDVGLDNVTNDAQVKRSEMGAADGVATLDSSGKLVSAQIPDKLAFLTNVVTVATMNNMPVTAASVVVNATGATIWSFASPLEAGQHVMILLKNTSGVDFTQPIPNVPQAGWDENNEETVNVPAGSYVELSCWYIGNLYTVIIREI